MRQLDRLRRLLLGRTPGARSASVDNLCSGTLPERCQGNDASQLKLLLADIRDAFGEALEIASADLVKALVTIEGRPWGKNGKPLTQKKLAQMLKPLGIAPDRIGPENARQRGYKLWAFEEVFACLPPEGVHWAKKWQDAAVPRGRRHVNNLEADYEQSLA